MKLHRVLSSVGHGLTVELCAAAGAAEILADADLYPTVLTPTHEPDPVGKAQRA
jgi:hypothetical protein